MFARVPRYLAYNAFANRVRDRNRFLQTIEISAFLDWIARTASAHVQDLPAGTHLWRAQVGCNTTHAPVGTVLGGLSMIAATHEPYDETRMRPNPAFVRAGGRANPFGIAYLYLADSAETAIAEVRPWAGAHVSVADFTTTRNLRLVDLTTTTTIMSVAAIAACAPDSDEVDTFIWDQINTAFAAPVSPEDAQLDYVPTQYLSEYFREKGYAGVRYISTLSTAGINYMLFDSMDAAYGTCNLYRIERAVYDHTQLTVRI